MTAPSYTHATIYGGTLAKVASGNFHCFRVSAPEGGPRHIADLILTEAERRQWIKALRAGIEPEGEDE